MAERKKIWRWYRERKKCGSWSEENDSSDKEELDEVIEFGSKFKFNFDFSKTIWSTRLVPHAKTKPKITVTSTIDNKEIIEKQEKMKNSEKLSILKVQEQEKVSLDASSKVLSDAPSLDLIDSEKQYQLPEMKLTDEKQVQEPLKSIDLSETKENKQ